MVKYLELQRISQMHMAELETAMLRVLHSGQYLYGPDVATFEADFAQSEGARYGVGTGNGLDALTLALWALKDIEGWKDGDEVIVSGHTFIATIEAITRVGLRPVFCDVREEDFLIDTSLIEGLITPRTRCLLPVHLYGKACDMDTIAAIARRHGLKIVEDTAQAHGAALHTQSDASAYSFYPGKNLGALADAGAITTNSEQLARHMRMLGNYGSEIKYCHEYQGINSRLDDLQAAILSVKLRHLKADNQRRQAIARRYLAEIVNPHIQLPYQKADKDTRESVYHIFPVLCDKREQLEAHLDYNGIGHLRHYPTPPHKQPAYREYAHLSLPVTERICATEVSIPLHPAMTESEIAEVIATLNTFKPE